MLDSSSHVSLSTRAVSLLATATNVGLAPAPPSSPTPPAGDVGEDSEDSGDLQIPECVLLWPQCEFPPLSSAPAGFRSLAPLLPCHRRPPPPDTPAAGRAMIRTDGSEPSVNQKASLPSFTQTGGAFHAGQCDAVFLQDTSSPGLTFATFAVFSVLSGRGNIRGRQSCRYGTPCAPVSPPCQEISMSAGERWGSEQTLVFCCRY